MAVHPEESTEQIRYVSLFSGCGAADLAFSFAVPFSECVLYCEREAQAAEILVARIQEGLLHDAPIWSDLSSLSLASLRGSVDAIVASPPCQEFSVAGKGAGNKGERAYGSDGRGPLYHFCRVIGECRPAVVICENVPPWIRGGHFQSVGDELCRMGYTVESPLFLSAANVGASHKRERVFVVAHCRAVGLADRPAVGPQGTSNRSEQQGWRRSVVDVRKSVVDSGRERLSGRDGLHAGRMGGETTTPEGERQDTERQRLRDASVHDGVESVGNGDQSRADADAAKRGLRRTVGESDGPVVDGQHVGRKRSGRTRTRRLRSASADRSLDNAQSGGSGEERTVRSLAVGVMDDADCEGSSGRGVSGCERTDIGDIGTAGLPLNPPGPKDRNGWRYVIERWPWLAPAISEEEIKSILCRMVDADAGVLDFAHRVDRLRAAGNAVDVIQAGVAFRVLLSRIGYLNPE